MAEENRLGIWGNTECLQCGACCYELYMFIKKKPCSSQEFRDAKSCCLVHDQSERDYVCERFGGKSFFCGDLNNISGGKEHMKKLRQIAFELETVPEQLEIRS